MFIHVLKPKLNYATLSDEPSYEIVVINNRRMLVHRLIAEAFHGPRPLGKIVHHRDHVKRNNKPKNLEYVTPSENTRLAYADGRIGRTHKLTAFARAKVVEMYETGKFRTPQLAEQFRVHRSTILHILRKAGAQIHRMRKLTPEIYGEIRGKWIPYRYPVSRLAREYKVSSGLIEAILGMRAFRPGKWLPLVDTPNPRLAVTDERLVELYGSGIPLKEISEQVGIGVTRIQVRLKKCGVERRHKFKLRGESSHE